MGELRFPCVQFLKLQNSEKVNQIPCPRDWESRFVLAKWKACSFSILLSPPPLNTSIWVVLCHYLLLNIKFIRFCDCTLWIDHTWCNHFLYWRPHFLPLFMKMGWKCKSVLGFLVICFYIFEMTGPQGVLILRFWNIFWNCFPENVLPILSSQRMLWILNVIHD